MNKLIIFDYDGVLADSLQTVIDTINSLAVTLGVNANINSADFDEIEDMTYGKIMEKAGLSGEILSAAAPLMFAEFIEKAKNIKFFDGIHGLLKKLSENNKVAVVSGNTKSVITDKFKQENVFRYISLIYGADTPGDKAEKIQDACLKTHISKENTFMVGDSISDIVFGRKAGAKTVAVTWGWQSAGILEKVKPDFVANNVKELTDILN